MQILENLENSLSPRSPNIFFSPVKCPLIVFVLAKFRILFRSVGVYLHVTTNSILPVERVLVFFVPPLQDARVW